MVHYGPHFIPRPHVAGLRILKKKCTTIALIDLPIRTGSKADHLNRLDARPVNTAVASADLNPGSRSEFSTLPFAEHDRQSAPLNHKCGFHPANPLWRQPTPPVIRLNDFPFTHVGCRRRVPLSTTDA